MFYARRSLPMNKFQSRSFLARKFDYSISQGWKQTSRGNKVRQRQLDLKSLGNRSELCCNKDRAKPLASESNRQYWFLWHFMDGRYPTSRERKPHFHWKIYSSLSFLIWSHKFQFLSLRAETRERICFQLEFIFECLSFNNWVKSGCMSIVIKTSVNLRIAYSPARASQTLSELFANLGLQ